MLLSSSDEEAGSDPPGPGRDPNEAKIIAAASPPAQLAQKKSKGCPGPRQKRDGL